jgi:hypothetical protein
MEVQGNGPFGRPWVHTEQCEHPAGHSGLHEVITDPLPGMRPWTDDEVSR